MARHKTIEDFQLVRHKRAPLVQSTFHFIEPFVGNTIARDWEIWDMLTENGLFLHQYAVCVPKGAYLILNVMLVDTLPPHRRETEMRLHQVIAANWLATGARLETLRWIGVHWIVNKDSRASALRAFASQIAQGKADPEATQVTVAADETWSEPFIKSACHLAEGMGHRRRPVVLSASFLRYDLEDDTELDMVLDLERAE